MVGALMSQMAPSLEGPKAAAQSFVAGPSGWAANDGGCRRLTVMCLAP
jgi:hypothetical protein